MPLSPDDWWIHVQSTRDLADRMLIRGDTKGAAAMLHAAMELERRKSMIMNFTPIDKDEIGSSAFDCLLNAVGSNPEKAQSFSTPSDVCNEASLPLPSQTTYNALERFSRFATAGGLLPFGGRN